MSVVKQLYLYSDDNAKDLLKSSCPLTLTITSPLGVNPKKTTLKERKESMHDVIGTVFAVIFKIRFDFTIRVCVFVCGAGKWLSDNMSSYEIFSHGK